MTIKASVTPPLLEGAKPCATKADGFELHTVVGRLVDPSLNLDRVSALIMMEDEAYKYKETADGGAA